MKLIPIKATFLILAFAAPLGMPAQNVYWNASSARSAGMSGIFVPAPDGALDAISTNPAGLTYIQGRVVTAAVLSGVSRGSFSNTVNVDAPLSSSPSAFPFGAAGARLSRRFSAGIAETPLVTATSDWAYVDAPGTAGASYGRQENKSAILVARTAVGAGMDLGKYVGIGVTLGVDYNSNTLQGVYVFQSQPVVKGLKTLLDLRTVGYGINGGTGILVRPSSRLTLGVAWKSKSEIRSTGTASGNLGAQLAAVGLAARPDFSYRASVHNTIPQSFVVTGGWRLRGQWHIAAQAEWIGWKSAFKSLNVALTEGNNTDINGLVGSSSLNDSIPLQWKNQIPVRIGVQRNLTENIVMQTGFAHTNNAVPNSTVLPLTAAIFQNRISAGARWHKGSTVFDGAYGFVPTSTSTVGKSSILSGEYSNSRISAGLQLVTLSVSHLF